MAKHTSYIGILASSSDPTDGLFQFVNFAAEAENVACVYANIMVQALSNPYRRVFADIGYVQWTHGQGWLKC